MTIDIKKGKSLKLLFAHPKKVIKMSETQLKIYTGQASKILKFLQAGCSHVQAAHAVGVTESYVSQLCNEMDFKLQIAQKLQSDFEKAIVIDKNYEAIEFDLTEKLKKQVPYILGLDDILKSLKILQGVKKKIASPISPGINGEETGVRTVKLVLPQVLVQNFIVNPNSEVVAVDKTNLVTLNANSIDALAQKMINSEITEIESQPAPKLKYVLPEKVIKNEQPKDKYGNL